MSSVLFILKFIRDSLDRLIYGIIEILKINMGNGIYERANLYFQQN